MHLQLQAFDCRQNLWPWMTFERDSRSLILKFRKIDEIWAWRTLTRYRLDGGTSKNLPNFDLLEGLENSGGMKSSNFYYKRHILAWIHVVWAILREDPLGGLSARAKRAKSPKVTETPIKWCFAVNTCLELPFSLRQKDFDSDESEKVRYLSNTEVACTVSTWYKVMSCVF